MNQHCAGLMVNSKWVGGLIGRGVSCPENAVGDVLGSCGVEAESPVRTAADSGTVVVVLAVVFPPAFVADFVPAALSEGRVAAARTGVRPVVGWSLVETVSG